MKDITIGDDMRFRLAYEIAKMEANEKNANLAFREAPPDQPSVKTDRFNTMMNLRHELKGALAILELIGLPDMQKAADEVRRKITVMV